MRAAELAEKVRNALFLDSRDEMFETNCHGQSSAAKLADECNARLAPIHEKLILCVNALDRVANYGECWCHPYDDNKLCMLCEAVEARVALLESLKESSTESK